MKGYRVLEWEYDKSSNKTQARIETPNGTDWFTVSGYVGRSDILKWVVPTMKKNTGKSSPRRRATKRKNAPRRKNAGSKSKLLKNFTGVVRLNKDKTVSIIGTGKKANPARKRAKRRAKR
jgi:hypothetical protein